MRPMINGKLAGLRFAGCLVLMWSSWVGVARGEDPLAAERYSVKRTSGLVYAKLPSGDLTCDVYTPGAEGKRPCVLLIHGGGWAAGASWQMNYHARYLAERGYSVVSINYRLAPKHKFPAQLDDCVRAIQWMCEQEAARPFDMSRFAVMGYSAGAQLACLLSYRWAADPDTGDFVRLPDSVVIRAVVGGGTPADFRELPASSRALAYWLGGTRNELPEQYRIASPATFVTSECPATLLYHGQEDLLVPRESARKLFDKLQQAEVPAEYLELSEKGHVGAFFHRESLRDIERFLRAHIVAASRPAEAATESPKR